jgi:hypothetical protein
MCSGHKRILGVESLMMDSNEFAKRLLFCANGDISIEELEGWFDSNSWNVHQQGIEALTNAVFEFEEIYSAYIDGRMGEHEVRHEMRRLANAASPFYYKASPVEVDRLTVYEIGRLGTGRAFSVSSGIYSEWNLSHAPTG